jgi:UDP-glucose 4-epimerase
MPEPGQRGSILLTGGAGFIGANLSRLLVRHGYQVTVLDDFSVGSRESLSSVHCAIVFGSVLDAAILDEVVPGHQAIVHLAAQTGVPASLDDPVHDFDVNVRGTLSVLESIRRCLAAGGAGIPRFIFASSNAALGRQAPPANEDKAPLPISPYGAGKLAGEGYVLAYHGAWGIGGLALRFGNVYGPYSAHKSSVVAKMIASSIGNRPLTIDGDGRQSRDFIYVDDLAAAIVAAIESPIGGEVLQISSGRDTSILDLVAKLRQLTATCPPVRHGPPRQGDVRVNYSTISKAKQLLGWQPAVSLDEGLRRTYAWFAARPS